jgi:hypothetical protein
MFSSISTFIILALLTWRGVHFKFILNIVLEVIYLYYIWWWKEGLKVLTFSGPNTFLKHIYWTKMHLCYITPPRGAPYCLVQRPQAAYIGHSHHVATNFFHTKESFSHLLKTHAQASVVYVMLYLHILLYPQLIWYLATDFSLRFYDES